METSEPLETFHPLFTHEPDSPVTSLDDNMTSFDAATDYVIKPVVVNKISAMIQIVLGGMIFVLNLLVIAGFKRKGGLSLLVRIYLADVAAADVILGFALVLRGALEFVEEKSMGYCPHVLGLLGGSSMVVYGTVALCSLHTVAVLSLGARYDKVRALRWGVAGQVAAWLPGIACYLALVLDHDEVTIEVSGCSGTSGYTPGYVMIGSGGYIFISLLFCIVAQITGGIKLRRLLLREKKLKPGASTKDYKLDASEGNDVNVVNDVTGSGPYGIQQSIKSISSNGKKVGTDSASLSKSKLERSAHAYKIILIMSSMVGVFVFPTIVVQIMAHLDPFLFSDILWLPSTLFSAALINSLTNIVVYYIKDSGFRQSVKYLITFSCCRDMKN